MINWYFLCRPVKNNGTGYIALAKREPFVCDGDALREPGELWFEFGTTPSEALSKLRAELGVTVI